MLGLVPVTDALERYAPASDPWALVEGEKVDGIDTVGLQVADPAREDTIYVSPDGPGYPVMLVAGIGDGLSFTKWGAKAPKVAAPTGTVVDAAGSKLR